MKATSWTITDRNERVTKVIVQARTQRQLELSRRNATNPPPPPYSPRRRPSS
jgi:hypothetical protein